MVRSTKQGESIESNLRSLLVILNFDKEFFQRLLFLVCQGIEWVEGAGERAFSTFRNFLWPWADSSDRMPRLLSGSAFRRALFQNIFSRRGAEARRTA
ncbi:MAG: hypothetical protein ACLFQ6_07780 [Candidatus Sumerlaeia bacterium]